MARTGSSEYRLAGFSCVSKPNCTQDQPDAPLMYALGYALDGDDDLAYFLTGIFPPYPPNTPGGGDPGWFWYPEKSDDNGETVVVVELTPLIAPPGGIWSSYDERKIRYEVRAALDNYAVMFPARLKDIDKVIHAFSLEDVECPAGLKRIPKWTGTVPSALLRNE